MADQLSQALAALVTGLDARPIPHGPEHDWPACPVCGRQTPPSIHGGVAVCYLCTVREVGALPSELAAAAFHKVKVSTWQAWVDLGTIPSMTYRAWRRRTGR